MKIALSLGLNIYYSPSFWSRTSHKPNASVNTMHITANSSRLQVLSIFANIEDNNTAVVTYLAISISHFPNSFFILYGFVLANIRRIEDSMVILMEFLQYLFLLLHLRRYQPNIYQISLQLAFPTDDRYDTAS